MNVVSRRSQVNLMCFFLTWTSVSSPALAYLGLEGFSSGRYEVRKEPKKTREPSSLVMPAVPAVPKKVKSDPEPVRSKEELRSVAVAADEEPTEESSAAIIEPSINEQIRGLFTDDLERVHRFYKQHISPEDPRNNRVEIDVLPLFSYVDSQSNYSYRQFQSFYSAMKIKSNVWITPRVGLTGSILFSLAADVDSGNSNNSRVPATFETIDLGLSTRTFFGTTPLSSSMEFAVLYSDSKMTVPSDNVARPRLKSQGLGLAVKARIPISAKYASTTTGSLFPRLQHTESVTGLSIRSGAPTESIRLGVDVGGEWMFERQSQILWNLGVVAERNVFDGPASTPDLNTGLTPSNVSATSATYSFTLGYRWGH